MKNIWSSFENNTEDSLISFQDNFKNIIINNDLKDLQILKISKFG